MRADRADTSPQAKLCPRWFRRYSRFLPNPMWRFRRNRGIKQIPTARYCLDQAVIGIIEFVTQLPNALHYGGIGHGYIGPYSGVELPLGHQAPGIVYQVSKNLKRLGPQLYILLARTQTPAYQVERKSVEA
jgi:hypothetical protein